MTDAVVRAALRTVMNSGNLLTRPASNRCRAIRHAAGQREVSHDVLSDCAAIAALCCSPLPAICAAHSAKPTDPQIAHIAYTAGQIDIEAAKQALKKSKNKEVRAFAEDMVSDHSAVNKQALALVKKLKVTPEDNATSKALTKQAAAKRAELAKLNGAAFDKAYVDNEVAYHKTVNNALETQLIPSASNAELKSLLQTGLKIFQGHEQHAEHVACRAEVRSLNHAAGTDRSFCAACSTQCAPSRRMRRRSRSSWTSSCIRCPRSRQGRRHDRMG